MTLQQHHIKYIKNWQACSLTQAVLEAKWRLTLSDSRLYEIFDRLGLSTSAHRVYGYAKSAEQADFVEALKKSSGWPKHRLIC